MPKSECFLRRVGSYGGRDDSSIQGTLSRDKSTTRNAIKKKKKLRFFKRKEKKPANSLLRRAG